MATTMRTDAPTLLLTKASPAALKLCGLSPIERNTPDGWTEAVFFRHRALGQTLAFPAQGGTGFLAGCAPRDVASPGRHPRGTVGRLHAHSTWCFDPLARSDAARRAAGRSGAIPVRRT